MRSLVQAAQLIGLLTDHNCHLYKIKLVQDTNESSLRLHVFKEISNHAQREATFLFKIRLFDEYSCHLSCIVT